MHDRSENGQNVHFHSKREIKDGKEEARPAGGTAERAKGESHWTSGNPCVQNSTERGGGQETMSWFPAAAAIEEVRNDDFCHAGFET